MRGMGWARSGTRTGDDRQRGRCAACGHQRSRGVEAAVGGHGRGRGAVGGAAVGGGRAVARSDARRCRWVVGADRRHRRTQLCDGGTRGSCETAAVAELARGDGKRSAAAPRDVGAHRLRGGARAAPELCRARSDAATRRCQRQRRQGARGCGGERRGRFCPKIAGAA